MNWLSLHWLLIDKQKEMNVVMCTSKKAPLELILQLGCSWLSYEVYRQALLPANHPDTPIMIIFPNSIFNFWLSFSCKVFKIVVYFNHFHFQPKNAENAYFNRRLECCALQMLVKISYTQCYHFLQLTFPFTNYKLNSVCTC